MRCKTLREGWVAAASDLKKNKPGGLVLLAGVGIAAAAILSIGIGRIGGDYRRALACSGMAVVGTVVAMKFTNKTDKNSAENVTDSLFFLATVAFGPYEGAVIGAIAVAIGTTRLRGTITLYLFNGSTQAVSLWLGGVAYVGMARWLAQGGTTQGSVIVTLTWPLICLASVFTVVSLLLADMLSSVRWQTKFGSILKGNLKWELPGSLVSALGVGIVKRVGDEYGVLGGAGTVVVLAMVAAFVYMASRARRDRLEAATQGAIAREAEVEEKIAGRSG